MGGVVGCCWVEGSMGRGGWCGGMVRWCGGAWCGWMVWWDGVVGWCGGVMWWNCVVG